LPNEVLKKIQICSVEIGKTHGTPILSNIYKIHKIMLKIRIILFLIFLGLFSLSFQIGAMSKVSYEDANDFSNEFLAVMEDTDGIGIFVNNFLSTLPMFIPGFGIIWGLYIAWSTGFGFAAIISTIPGLSDIQPLSILFLSSFGVMELIAYSIALSCGFLLIYTIIKNARSQIKSVLKLQIKPNMICIGIVMILLLVAGFLEDYMIKSAQAL